MNLDFSLHDAEIQSVRIGPRREIQLMLALGSARISDGRLPAEATLRIGGIENFGEIRNFFAHFEPAPIARIDRMTVVPGPGASANVALKIDPQGLVRLVCSKLELIPSEIA